MNHADSTPAPLEDVPISRRIQVGGMDRAQLLAMLEAAGIALNELGRALLNGERFTTTATAAWVETLEVSVEWLGLPKGALMPQMLEQARAHGLRPSPLELAPHLRLQLLDQAEGPDGSLPSKHCAPAGSITVATEYSATEEGPCGFYLRRIAGKLWLRGYQSGPEHLWSPRDRLVFIRSQV